MRKAIGIGCLIAAVALAVGTMWFTEVKADTPAAHVCESQAAPSCDEVAYFSHFIEEGDHKYAVYYDRFGHETRIIVDDGAPF